MPLYDFECNKCSERFERFFKMAEKKNAYCPKCEGKARRIYYVGMPNFGFKPFFSENLSPDPNRKVWVESRAMKKSLMKKYHLAENG